MATDRWIDPNDNSDPWTTASDWSTGAVPTSTSSVTVAEGAPVVEAPFTVAEITDSSAIVFDDAGLSTVTGTVDVTRNGLLTFDPPGPEPDGGSSLTIDGALTNAGTVSVGTGPNAPGYTLDAPDTLTAASINNTGGTLALWGGPSVLAEVDVNGAASLGTKAGVLDGTVTLSGDAELEFASGSITTIAANSLLSLTGDEAVVDDAGGAANSALSGMKTIDGGLELFSSAPVSTGALTVASGGYVSLDAYPNDGGSALNVDGALTNKGSIDLGPSDGSLTAATSFSASSINNTDGTLDIYGAGYDAALTISGKASFGATAGVLEGSVVLSGDALVTFGSGEITKIDGDLTMFGSSAGIDDSGGAQNSALKGTTSIGTSGELDLENASLKTTGALTNTGSLYLDNDYMDGGSTLSVGKKITNEGVLEIGALNGDLSANSSLATTALDNSGGRIALQGNSPYQALLHVTGAADLGTAAGQLDGIVNLQGDSAIEFASGALTTIESGADFDVYGAQAFVEDAGSLGSNSALNIGTVDGGWNLYEGAEEAATTLTVGSSGSLYVSSNSAGNSALTISGALVNNGTVSLNVSGTGDSTLSVAGTTTNNGAFYVTDDTETLAGPIAGTGDFYLTGSTLTIDSSVSSGQEVQFNSPSTLALASATSNSFSGTLENFGTGDAIDAQNFKYGSTSIVFSPNAQNTGGTLVLTYGTLTDNILMNGSYSTGDFQPAMDGGTGTLIKFA
jgi:hypothetical protein